MNFGSICFRMKLIDWEFVGDRYLMDASGENTGKKWRRETRALGLIIVAPWPPDALFGSKYVLLYYELNFFLS